MSESHFDPKQWLANWQAALKRSFRSEIREALEAQERATKELRRAYGIEEPDHGH